MEENHGKVSACVSEKHEAEFSHVSLVAVLESASPVCVRKKNTKTETSIFDAHRILVFCILHFAVSEYVCRMT
jgi:hypothetical protein